MYIDVQLFSVQCSLISVMNVFGDNDLSGFLNQVYVIGVLLNIYGIILGMVLLYNESFQNRATSCRLS